MNEISQNGILPLLQSLSSSFFLQDNSIVARALLNCVLYTWDENNAIVGGRIVETESYTQDDEASHSYKGQTKRCRAMFMQGGIAYVYVIYGMHHCCNVVTGAVGSGNAVLLRSLEPYWGLDIMAVRRSVRVLHYSQNDKFYSKTKTTERTETALCRGPGCMSMALGITTSQYNETALIRNKISEKSAQKGRIHLMNLPASMHVHSRDIVTTTRIGITKSVKSREQKSRFYINHNSCVSYPLKCLM